MSLSSKLYKHTHTRTHTDTHEQTHTLIQQEQQLSPVHTLKAWRQFTVLQMSRRLKEQVCCRDWSDSWTQQLNPDPHPAHTLSPSPSLSLSLRDSPAPHRTGLQTLHITRSYLQAVSAEVSSKWGSSFCSLGLWMRCRAGRCSVSGLIPTPCVSSRSLLSLLRTTGRGSARQLAHFCGNTSVCVCLCVCASSVPENSLLR